MQVKRDQDDGAAAINVKKVVTRRGVVIHHQVFIWTDENARAMQDAILDQQQREWDLRIPTRRLLGLLDAVRMSAPEKV